MSLEVHCAAVVTLTYQERLMLTSLQRRCLVAMLVRHARHQEALATV